MQTGDIAAWRELLARFERALDDPEEIIDVEEIITPPGPVPEEIHEQMRSIISRQRVLVDRTALALASTARELQALRKIPETRGDSPAFLDLEG